MLTCNVTYSWWFAFPLYGGGVSVTADAAKTLDQRSLREARVYGMNRILWGVSIGDGEYGAPTIPAPPWVPGAHKTFIGGSRVLPSLP